VGVAVAVGSGVGSSGEGADAIATEAPKSEGTSRVTAAAEYRIFLLLDVGVCLFTAVPFGGRDHAPDVSRRVCRRSAAAPTPARVPI
jgi:hypothetical protein